jgi:hypothetical protein
MKRCLVAAVLVWNLAAPVTAPLTAQGQETFKTRLSPVPIDAQLAPVVTGSGSVSAVLAGAKLTVTGSFEGMHSAATAAQLFQSKMTGVRGTSIHDLTVAKTTGGAVSGSVDLTPPEVEALRKGLIYVVVNSAGAPDGNLWGWLLK